MIHHDQWTHAKTGAYQYAYEDDSSPEKEYYETIPFHEEIVTKRLLSQFSIRFTA